MRQLLAASAALVVCACGPGSNDFPSLDCRNEATEIGDMEATELGTVSEWTQTLERDSRGTILLGEESWAPGTELEISLRIRRVEDDATLLWERVGNDCEMAGGAGETHLAIPIIVEISDATSDDLLWRAEGDAYVMGGDSNVAVPRDGEVAQGQFIGEIEGLLGPAATSGYNHNFVATPDFAILTAQTETGAVMLATIETS